MTETVQETINLVDITCSICRDILYKPVTLLCQHNFCRKCVLAQQDRKCGLCRLSFVIPREYNRALDSLAQSLFPAKHKLRVEQEELDLFALSEKEKIQKQLYADVFNTVSEVALEEFQQTNERAVQRQSIAPEQNRILRLQAYRAIGEVIFFLLCLNTIAVALSLFYARDFDVMTTLILTIASIVDCLIVIPLCICLLGIKLVRNDIMARLQQVPAMNPQPNVRALPMLPVSLETAALALLPREVLGMVISVLSRL